MHGGFYSDKVNIRADRGNGLPPRVQLTLWVYQTHPGDLLFGNDLHPFGAHVTIRHIRTANQCALYEVKAPQHLEEVLRQGFGELLAATDDKVMTVINSLRTELLKRPKRPDGPGVTQNTGRG